MDLISSEFHLPRAMYLFEAVLAAHKLQISIVPIPAPTPPPGPGDMGINALRLSERIEREEEICSTESPLLEIQLDRFNPKREVPVRPLPVARKKEARAELL